MEKRRYGIRQQIDRYALESANIDLVSEVKRYAATQLMRQLADEGIPLVSVDRIQTQTCWMMPNPEYGRSPHEPYLIEVDEDDPWSLLEIRMLVEVEK